MKKTRSVLASLLMLSLAQATAHATESATKSFNGLLTVAGDVPSEQATTLGADLDFLRTLPVRGDDGLRKLLETSSAVGVPALERWLAERVQYVISEKMRMQVVGSEDDYPYENPGLFPPMSPPPVSPVFIQPESTNQLGNDNSGTVVVMQNVGVSLYLMGKESGKLAGLKVPGVAGLVPMTSPRTGIIKIGQGMFMPLMKKDGVDDTNSPAYRIFRLAVLFHEARHSDGNGESLGFLHTICPIGHDYEGTGSCDLATNGAYVMGAATIKNLSASCASCSTEEKEALKLLALDSISRLLDSGPKYRKEANDIYECQKLGQSFMARMMTNRKDWNYCQTLLTKNIETIEASDWDARPEGSRK